MLTKSDIETLKSILVTKEDLKPIKNDIVNIRKDMKVIINFFDHEYLDLRKRVERIEEHLHLPPVT